MFGFGDIGSMFSKGMAQYGQGLDKMRDLPMAQKLMAAGQIAHGGVGPGDFMGAVSRFGQPPGTPDATGATGPGAPPAMPPPIASAPPPPAPQQGAGQNPMLMGLLPMLMQQYGMGGGAGGGGAPTGGMGALGMGLGGLLGKFGFGH